MSDEKKPATKPTRPAGLRYVGDGATLPDVPARDLSADDLTELVESQSEMFKTVYQAEIETPAALRAWLIKSGLYAAPS
jgi:hypothetical protein